MPSSAATKSMPSGNATMTRSSGRTSSAASTCATCAERRATSAYVNVRASVRMAIRSPRPSASRASRKYAARLSRVGITGPRLNSNVMPVHRLASLTWPAVRDLPASRTVAVLPAGAIEAHGPHLPLGTDVIIAEAMARAGADRLSARGLHVLLLPALTMAPAPFAAAFAGTVDAPAEATTMTVLGIARSLAAHGVRVTAVANAHHDPAHVNALRRAVTDAATSDGNAVIVFPDL